MTSDSLNGKKEGMAQSDILAPTVTIEVGASEEVQLKQRFSLIGVIGIQVSAVATPLAIGSYVQLILGLGGSPFFFWGYCVAFFFQLLVCISLAEIASAHPHAAG